MNALKQYKGVARGIRSYWTSYGGIPAVFTSPFFHVSILVCILVLPSWWDASWWESSLTIVPAILGFSIASFTIMLGLGDEHFRLMLGVRRREGSESTLTKVSAGFFHFIVVQILAIVIALVAQGRPLTFLFDCLDVSPDSIDPTVTLLIFVGSKLFRFLGALLLIYTLLTALASMLNVFRLARIFSDHATVEFAKRKKGNGPK